jgi:hypothetical protein
MRVIYGSMVWASKFEMPKAIVSVEATLFVQKAPYVAERYRPRVLAASQREGGTVEQVTRPAMARS